MKNEIIDLVIKWAVPFLCGALITFLVWILKRQKAFENGMQCLLRMSILETYETYTDKGYCPIHIKDGLSRAYNAYHGLGGDDIATKKYEITIDLPDEPEIKTQ